jgi:molybdate transport system substrate-binding protein
LPTLLVAIATLLAACSGTSGTSVGPSAAASTAPSAAAASAAPSLPTDEVIVFAAASLKDVLKEAVTTYVAANPNTKIFVSTDASSALATQIQQGAPADLFLSADTKNPDTLATAGLTTGATVPFVGNTLTVIVPLDNQAGITSPKDLANAGIKVIAAGDEVPITKYANQAVDNLAKVAGYPADFAAKYGANIVSKEPNVKGIVAKVELGEGDGGIVYVTDAKASTKVKAVEIPAEANVPATYGGVVIKGAKYAADAQAFFDWLKGTDGQALFATYGFLPPPA